MWGTFRANCASLRQCPKELWLIFVVKVLESYSYFSMSLIYVVFLTDTFGVGDVAAGGSYGLWGMLTVAWGVVLGPVIDGLGIRRSLLVGFAVELVSRLLIATATSRPLLYLLLYTLLPAASSLGVPVMTIAVKRYTPHGARSLAFGLFYTVMNVAALAAGFIVDALRTVACRALGAASGGAGSMLMQDSNRLVIASGALTSAVALVVTAFLSRAVETEALERERADAQGWGGIAAGAGAHGIGFAVPELASPSMRHQLHSQTAGVDDPDTCHFSHPHGAPPASACGLRPLLRAVLGAVQKLNSSISEMLSYPGMWKYLVMALFLLNLRQTYRYLDSMLPKYMQRFIGCGAPFGKIYAINPAMIIVLVPLVTAATARVAHFDMVHYGSYVSASSPLWVHWIRYPAVLGPVVFVVQLSLGEAVWSPRWYDYTMDIAPTGKEGLFGGIAAAPLFLAKVPTGLLSGYLLDHFCPLVGEGCAEGGDAQCGAAEAPVAIAAAAGPAAGVGGGADGRSCDPTMWLVVGVVTMLSPLLITAFSRWLRPGPGEGGHTHGGAGGVEYVRADVMDETDLRAQGSSVWLQGRVWEEDHQVASVPLAAVEESSELQSDSSGLGTFAVDSQRHLSEQ
eukprot:jgi/Ulvmu1/6550/UM003_0184.1